jgi:predicted metal-dependent phosphoesterase TrpH
MITSKSFPAAETAELEFILIDLHIHSTFSDGSMTPEAIVELAARIGLKTISLTDHDGMGGITRFMEACRTAGIQGIPGIEISVACKSGTLHMLGYFLKDQNPHVEQSLLRVRQGREDRNQLILEKMNHMGYPLTWQDVVKFAGEDVVGRPHFALALIEKGYFKKKDEVFDRLLGKGKPAYVDRCRLTAEESIAMIRQEGGVCVLAHPMTLGLHRKGLRTVLTDLAGKGLQGIEAYYPEHDASQTRMCLALAKEFNLAVTGGSDFHGALNPAIKLGSGFGNLAIPDELVDQLHERFGSH